MKSFRPGCFRLILALVAGMLVATVPVRAEVILQYFNVSWKELADKMPELAEVGYGSRRPRKAAADSLSVMTCGIRSTSAARISAIP
jgi:hypothetical protein